MDWDLCCKAVLLRTCSSSSQGGNPDLPADLFAYLVAILVAVGVFRTAGGIDILTRLLSPVLDVIGLPPQVLPLVLVRPLSGSEATGLFAEIVKACGPYSYAAHLAGTILDDTAPPC
jgi:spore maturation protein B